MILSILIISLMGIILITLLYVVRNLLRKVEKQEDILIEYLNYLNRLSQVIEASDVKLKSLDHKGSFEADDEIGFFFKGVKELQDILNEFVIKKIKE